MAIAKTWTICEVTIYFQCRIRAQRLHNPVVRRKYTRTYEIDMDDQMRFTHSEITVENGDGILLFLKNSGQLPHEMVIGSLADLQAHAIEMRKNPGMKHVEPNAITLNPGQRGGLVWKFDQVGTIDFAYTIPGHMESRMVGKVQVGYRTGEYEGVDWF